MCRIFYFKYPTSYLFTTVFYAMSWYIELSYYENLIDNLQYHILGTIIINCDTHSTFWNESDQFTKKTHMSHYSRCNSESTTSVCPSAKSNRKASCQWHGLWSRAAADARCLIQYKERSILSSIELGPISSKTDVCGNTTGLVHSVIAWRLFGNRSYQNHCLLFVKCTRGAQASEMLINIHQFSFKN